MAWRYHGPSDSSREVMTSHDAKFNTDSKVHGANMGPTWVLSAPDEPHIGPMNLAIRNKKTVKSLCNAPLLIVYLYNKHC